MGFEGEDQMHHYEVYETPVYGQLEKHTETKVVASCDGQNGRACKFGKLKEIKGNPPFCPICGHALIYTRVSKTGPAKRSYLTFTSKKKVSAKAGKTGMNYKRPSSVYDQHAN